MIFQFRNLDNPINIFFKVDQWSVFSFVGTGSEPGLDLDF